MQTLKMQKLKVREKREIASNTLGVYLEKPEGFVFEAGQFIEVTLINPSEIDDKGVSRAFTIASAPYEEDLIFATRVRDTAFKRGLNAIGPGDEIAIDGPFGSFTLHKDASRPAVFLAGGIGITPFRSILLQATKEKLPHQLLLFYSNNRPEDASFLAELQLLEKHNSRFRLIATMTDLKKSHKQWAGNTGFINAEMIEQHISHPASAIYYTAGPPRMVRAMQSLLRNSGVDVESIRAEEFGGY